MRPDFALCSERATKLLSMQNLDTTMVDVRNLEYEKNIIFDSVQNYCLVTGQDICTFINDDVQLLSEGCTVYFKDHDLYLVLYNDKNQTLQHLNWTLAHEVGHIYMGHTSDDGIDEVEAHFFAAQFLMPEYTMKMMFEMYGNVSTEDVYSLFNVSRVAANKRIKTLKRRREIRDYEEDRIVWEMMCDSVKRYYESKSIGNFVNH